jgi:hypothetical protein
MLTDFLQNQAAIYSSGAMTATEREHFELILEFHHELRDFVFGLAEAGSTLLLATQPRGSAKPSPDLKGRISGTITNRPQHVTPDGIVVSGPDRLVQ